jgi:hypothetical protein
VQPSKIKPREGPEGKIQEAVIELLRKKDWFVKPTHGNLYSAGFPDLYCCHFKYRQRWVEIKNPLAYCFTGAQMRDFPRFSASGCGVWILVAATESEYAKLFLPENWHCFIKGMGR